MMVRAERGEADRVIVELGHFALILALLVALVQMVVPAGARTARCAPDGGRRAGRAGAARACSSCRVPGADPRLRHVRLLGRQRVANSHSTKPLIYQISGVWGNHEGSMLLWVLILALFGAAVAAVRRATCRPR